MKLFQFAIIYHPSADEKKDGKNSELIRSEKGLVIENVLADDEKQALLMAGRAIPEEHLKHLSQLEIAIRPF